MKRFIAIIMAAMLIFSFAACSTPATQEPATEAVIEAVAPLDLLNTVWASYAEDEKFPAAGGDMLTDETTNWEGPAAFSLDAEALNASLHFPTESVSKIDDAASLVHAMNANTFTAGVFHVANSADVDALTQEITATINSTQWMCGFPEKMLIATVGDTIVACVGNTDLIDTFNAKLAAAYPEAVVVENAAIVA